jgi:hypothetical protein
MSNNFNEEIINFFAKIYGLKSITPLLINVLSIAREETRQQFKGFMEKNSIEKENKGDQITYTFHAAAGPQLLKHSMRLKHFELACSLTPESFIVTMIGQYDAYLGKIISILLTKKPEILNSSDKKLTIADIITFPSLDDVKESIKEKEIESIIRESHITQIRWLERLLGITLSSEPELLSNFIEITERRNLFTHTGGIISNQYIKICKENGVKLPDDIKVGVIIGADEKYFIKSCDCILELGIKLAQIIWRKTNSDEIEQADLNLIQICYELIKAKEYKLAINLLIFGTDTIKKHETEQSELYLILNKAQAYKWDGNEEKCKDILKSIDWTAKSGKFLLVREVLEDRFDEAAKIMRTIKPNAELSNANYIDWPIFKRFRQTKEFQDAYKDIFGEEFKIIEVEK